MIKRNLLIDANNLFHRAHAIYAKDKTADELMANDKGYPTGLTYGTYSMLERWIEDMNDINRIMFFMDGMPKRRLKIDPLYKYKEESVSPGKTEAWITLCDGFRAKNELEVIFHVGSRMGIDHYWDPFEEADDLIASFIKTNPDDVNIIVSSDKDFYPLLAENPKVILYRPGVKGNRFFDAEKAADHMEELYSGKNDRIRIRPEHVLMFKALTGDSSDNIVGIPRIRKKIIAPLCGCTTTQELLDTGLPGFSKNEKKNTLELIDRIEKNLQLVKLIDDLPIEQMRRSSDSNFDVAEKIMYEDLNIRTINLSVFKTSSMRKIRVADPVLPDWLSDI